MGEASQTSEPENTSIDPKHSVADAPSESAEASKAATEATKASDYWSAKKGYAPNWYSFCSEVINERITGDPKTFPTAWALTTFSDSLPLPHLLEIGCLSGDKLFSLLKAGYAERASGTDIAEGAIAMGREKHGDALQLTVSDLNAPGLPQEAYSVILANGVLHHIANLEVCAQALYDALTPGGFLFASEFTGPQRYVYSAREISAIREGQMLLPEELRGEPFDPAWLAIKLDADPSESIRTRDIQFVLAATFDRLIARPYGGNVLMRALTPQFFAHYDNERDDHREAVKKLVTFDAQVSEASPSHHHAFVAFKASAPPP